MPCIDDSQLCHDALTIWRAGVEAVDSGRLMRGALQHRGDTLTVCGRDFRLAELNRIAVVGAGKAGAGMAAAIEDILGDEVVDQKVVGWVNVPADCVRSLRKIDLHAARPAGVNEPTTEGVAGSEKILEIVFSLGANDLCLVLISGGGSALLPAPIEGLTLADKQAVTRFLMNSGAAIGELNTVRKQLSRIKGGNLARTCRAAHTLTLIISDVVGDPLDVIASGPTVVDTGTAGDALAVLSKFGAAPPQVPEVVFELLKKSAREHAEPVPLPGGVENHIIGNNATALAAAAARAAELGYRAESLGSSNQGEANAEGRELAVRCLSVCRERAGEAPVCLLSGGEPVVQLAKTDRPRKGGRNQQLALAALVHLYGQGMPGIAVLSGGTDGEDGPTDAAGACASQAVIDWSRALGLDPRDFLAINDAYHFFEQAGGLIKTGPTHTNVMDLRVALVVLNVWRAVSTSEAETQRLAERLARALEPGDVVALIGQLGAGKTRLVRGVALALGVDRLAVASPTFVLVHEYAGRLPIYHFDTYRLKEPGDFVSLGADEYLTSQGVCFIEWADRVIDYLLADHLRVEIVTTGETTREFCFRAMGEKSAAILARMAQAASAS